MNQSVSEQCVDVLQACVTKMAEAGERRTQHALLLVNSKLLALYSKYVLFPQLNYLCTYNVHVNGHLTTLLYLKSI